MKSLKQFIFEKYESIFVKDLEVPYLVGDKEVHFQVPEIYSEDDFQIYIQDMYLEDFPGNESTSEEQFGKNAQNIYDTVFEYEKYEKSEEEPKDFIEFDKSKDNKIKDDDKLVFVTLTNLKFIIKFDEFELKQEEFKDTKKTLIQIFEAYQSNENNEYPLKLTLDSENIQYK